MNFSEGEKEILAADAPEEEKAAQMDPIDRRMLELGAARIDKNAIDELMTDLQGNLLIKVPERGRQ